VKSVAPVVEFAALSVRLPDRDKDLMSRISVPLVVTVEPSRAAILLTGVEICSASTRIMPVIAKGWKEHL